MNLMKRRTLSKGMLMTALVCGLVQWGGTAVHAEELQEFTLDPMVVTAQRMETRDLDTPAMTTVITAADIEKTGATTTMEALRNVPGFTDYSYTGTGDDFGTSSSRALMRGFDKATLVMINGAPINIMNYGSLSGIPVEVIERIEVVKGANSVLYGAEAIGGVINVITKKGSGQQKTTLSGTTGNYLQKWGATIQGEGYIVAVGKDYVDEFSPAQKPNVSGDKAYRHQYDYRRENAFTSLALSPNLQMNYLYSELDPSYIKKRISDGSQSGSGYGYEDRRQSLSLVYTDDDNNAKTIVAYNEKDMSSTQLQASGARKPYSGYIASNLYFDSQKMWKLSKNDTLIAGVTLKHEKYDDAFDTHLNNDRNSYGIYASWNKKFDEKFSAILGVRGQYYASTDFDQSYTEVMPQLQTVYKINDNTSWYTNIGKAFELPAINAHSAANGALNIISNYPVEPQAGWNYETGLKKITDTTATKLAVYHMDYKNKFAWKNIEEIVGNKDDKIQVNLGKFENTGVELEYKKYMSDKWSYNLGAAYQTPESYDEDKGQWKQESARVQFTAGVDYKLNKFSANMNCLFLGDREDSYYRYDGSKADKSVPDHKLKDRVKLNACLSYSPTKNQSLSFNMYNLLDRDDMVYNTEYYDLPFNWTLTYTHTF